MELITFNPDAITWKRGLWTTLVLFGALVAIIAFRLPLALWAGAGGMAVGLCYFDAPLRDRLEFALEITIIGAIVVAFTLMLAGTPPTVSPIQSALVLAVVIFAIGIMNPWAGPWIIAGFFGWGKNRTFGVDDVLVIVIQVALAAIAIIIWTNLRNNQLKKLPPPAPDIPGPVGGKDDKKDNKGGPGILWPNRHSSS